MTWSELLHPRDPDNGEFVERHGGWLHEMGQALAGHHRVHGRDLRAELDYPQIWGDGESFSVGPDEPLQRIWAQQGFDGSPRVAGKDEMDAAVAAGWTEMFRGVGVDREHGDQYAEQYRTGSMFGGLGAYGNGVYAMPDWREWNTAAYGATQMRLALHPDARVIDHHELKAMMRAEGNLGLGGAVGMSPEEATMADAGRYASALGYDAIRVYEMTDRPGEYLMDHPLEWVILNRTATMVQRADG